MTTSGQTLIEQLKITPDDIERRKAFFGFSEADTPVIQAIKPVIAAHIDEIISLFYEKILAHEEMDSLIGDADTLTRVKHYQRNYLLSLFDNQYDEEYILSRLRVGVVHRRIGVDQRFYVPAVFHLISIIRSILIAHGSSNDCSRCDQGIGVVEKLLLFDLSFIFDTYIYSLMEKVNQTSSKLKSYAENLEAKVMERTRRLEEQARYDGLTKLLNQQAFYAELKRELLRSQRKSHATVLIYFDLDGFKKLNDSQGHQRGDEILSLVGDCMRSTVRKHEILARYGGDEFCIVLAESTLADAKTTCRRLFEAIKTATKGSGIACSAGLALSLPEKGLDADTLVKRADTAMYKAKKTPGFTMEIAQG